MSILCCVGNFLGLCTRKSYIMCWGHSHMGRNFVKSVQGILSNLFKLNKHGFVSGISCRWKYWSYSSRKAIHVWWMTWLHLVVYWKLLFFVWINLTAQGVWISSTLPTLKNSLFLERIPIKCVSQYFSMCYFHFCVIREINKNGVFS